MPTNEILAYALDASANLTAQADWAASPTRQRGVQSGLAKSADGNKAWRQSAFMAAVLAQFVVELSDQDQLDDGDIAGAVARLRLAVGNVTRIKLAAPLNLYVASTGADSNDGLTPVTPMATLQAAWNLIATMYDLGGFMVTVNIVAGTYTQPLTCTGMPPGISSDNTVNAATCIRFQGNISDPSQVLLDVTGNNAITTQAGANIVVEGMTLVAPGFAALFATNRSGIVFGDVHFGASKWHMSATDSSNITNAGRPYAITGDATQAHMEAFSAGAISIENATITIAGVCNTQAFAIAYASGHIFAGGCAYINTSNYVVGSKYLADFNGTIDTNSNANVNFFPGTTPGSANAGGQYR